jgi:capsular polysaccharide biosynthesis protein
MPPGCGCDALLRIYGTVSNQQNIDLPSADCEILVNSTRIYSISLLASNDWVLMTFVLWILEQCYKANLPSAGRRLLPLVKFCTEKHRESLLRLVGLLSSKTLYPDAIEVARKALVSEPTDVNTLKILGVLYLRLERPQEALPYFARRDVLLNSGQEVETRLLESSLLDPVLAAKRNPYIKNLTNVIVDTGFWVVIDGEKLYSREVCGRSMGTSPSVWGRITSDERLLIMTLKPPTVRIDQSCVLLCGDENYSHWVMRYLMKLSLTEKSEKYSKLPLLINQDLKKFQREYLELLGIGSDKLIQLPRPQFIQCKDLFVPTMFRNHAVMREGIDWLRNRLSEYMRPSTFFSSRLFISRADSSGRKLMNEEELFAKLEKMGFQNLVLGEMTVREQIAAFAGAEIIVGPHGAGLTNIVFAPFTAAIIEINSTFIEHRSDFRHTAKQMGQRCFTVTSNDYEAIGNDFRNYDSNFFVDVDIVVDAVNAALQPC